MFVRFWDTIFYGSLSLSCCHDRRKLRLFHVIPFFNSHFILPLLLFHFYILTIPFFHSNYSILSFSFHSHFPILPMSLFHSHSSILIIPFFHSRFPFYSIYFILPFLLFLSCILLFQTDHSGSLNFKEFVELMKKIKLWKVFKSNDPIGAIYCMT